MEHTLLLFLCKGGTGTDSHSNALHITIRTNVTLFLNVTAQGDSAWAKRLWAPLPYEEEHWQKGQIWLQMAHPR